VCVCAARKYIRWDKGYEKIVLEYFSKYKKKANGLPGRASIETFLAAHPVIPYDWLTIKTKLMNEQNKLATMGKHALDALSA